jgi:hypothetical protein
MTRIPDQLWKTARRLALLLVGAHVLLGLILIVAEASPSKSPNVRRHRE